MLFFNCLFIKESWKKMYHGFHTNMKQASQQILTLIIRNVYSAISSLFMVGYVA